jgi:putative N6-adenine-specific DNA methylase
MEIKKDTVFDVAATSEQGCEEFLKQELEQRFKVDNVALEEGWVKFRATAEAVAQSMYSSQAAKRIILILASGSFENIDDLEKKAGLLDSNKLELLTFFLKGKTFRTVCDRTGVHDFNSMDAEQAVSAAVKKLFKEKGEDILMNLKAPDVTLYLRIIDDNYVLGIDCAGRELSKRQHLVFNNVVSTKGTIGFCALLFAGYKPGQLILDPFALSGNIMLEAALYESGTPVNYYTKHFTLMDIPEFRPIVDDVLAKTDSKIKQPPSKPDIICTDSSFNNISAQKKNAKIAGIDKFLAFSRTDIENIDIKTFDSSVDVVCSRIIEPSANVPEGKVRKIHEILFKNLKFITKKKSAFVFIVRNTDVLEEESAKQGFVVEDRKQVFQGQQMFWFVKMGRGWDGKSSNI